MIFYPKIKNLYRRQDWRDINKQPKQRALIEGEYCCDEFEAIDIWTVTEKVDGINVRIIFNRTSPHMLSFGGGSNNAQFPSFLFTYLQQEFTQKKLDNVFKESDYVVLFGEGYGSKIQAGQYYNKNVKFILFDVFCSGFWLDRDSVREIAQDLGVQYCKTLVCAEESDEHLVKPYWSKSDIVKFVKSFPLSTLAEVPHVMEGIVARSVPEMLFRNKLPIMFKLKCSDFSKENT